MSEPDQKQGKAGADGSVTAIGPDRPDRNSMAAVFTRLSITQLTMTALTLVFLWQWFDAHHEINGMQQQLSKKIAEMDGINSANQILMAQSRDQMRELAAKVAELESSYAESQSQRAALEALYNDLSASRDETVLAEAEQMLLIAAQQLQISANVKAALIAMQSADSRLQRMDRPALNGLRKAISQDMDRLRALPDVDLTGINFQIENLAVMVDELPLLYQQRISSETGKNSASPDDGIIWQKMLREIWQEAKKLVRIEDTGQAEIPLLPPNQEFFLRENLKLHLLSARFALLSHDEESFKRDIRAAQAWTSRYFSAKSAQGTRMQTELKQIAAANIGIEIPDINTSLQAVRNYRLSRDKTLR